MSYKQPKNSSEERLLVHNNFLCSFIFGIDCTEIWCHPNEYHQCIYEYWFSCVQIFTHLIYVLFRWFMEKFFLNFVPTESSFFFKEMYCFVENNWLKLFLGSCACYLWAEGYCSSASWNFNNESPVGIFILLCVTILCFCCMSDAFQWPFHLE